MSARERDIAARAVQPDPTVVGRCFGCDTDITKGMLKQYRAMRYGDSYMCNTCEGGGDD